MHSTPLACAILALSLSACLGPAEDGVDEAVENSVNAVMTANALTANALTANALTANALTANALTANALTANSLMQNELVQSSLNDPLAQRLMYYVVGCALPAGEEIAFEVNGATLRYEGQLGLAPEWAVEGGQCGEECQGWVSACVLARVNARGVSVPISIRGASKALDLGGEEAAQFGVREATYYGNIFTQPQDRHACLSPDQVEIKRVCGNDTANCVVDIVGSCKSECEGVTDAGGFVKCAADGRVYEQAVTVFLENGSL